MIPAESRMREIRTSGSMSGGVETDRMGAGLSTKRKRGQEAPDPTRHRATPRLYCWRWCGGWECDFLANASPYGMSGS